MSKSSSRGRDPVYLLIAVPTSFAALNFVTAIRGAQGGFRPAGAPPAPIGQGQPVPAAAAPAAPAPAPAPAPKAEGGASA